nr:synapsin-1-like isoform X2 [Vulpes vulpes]
MRTRGPGVPRAPRGPRRAAPPPVRASGRGPSCGGRRAAAPGEAPAAFPNPQAKCPPRALRSPPRRRGLSFQQAARAGARVGLRLSPQRGPTRPPPPLSPTLLRSPTQEKWRNSAFQGAQRPGPQRRRRAQKASHETARVRRSCLRGHTNPAQKPGGFETTRSMQHQAVLG